MQVSSFKTLFQAASSDFWKYWGGQVISSFGSSFTSFAIPLLIFKLTNSAINLSLSFVVNMLPYLLFGLIIGAWVDRTNRKRLMIVTDLLRAGVIASLPLLAFLGFLPIWWIYIVLFFSSALSISFDSAGVAAIPTLVKQEDLMTANGRIFASYSLVNVLGPLLAALLLTIVPLPALLWIDACSFLVSAASLFWVKGPFNSHSNEKKAPTSIRQDIVEGLRYILTHPLFRWLAFLLFLVNLIVPTIYVEIVLFAKQVLAVSDQGLGIFYSVGSIGVVVVSLAAGKLPKRWSFGVVGLGSLMIQGLLTIALAFTRLYWLALPLWALNFSMSSLFNINITSLAQASIPNHLLGRVASFMKVLTWSLGPLGTFICGIIIERSQNVALVYGWLGVLAFLIPISFLFTSLGRAKRYQPYKEIAPVKEVSASQ